MHDHSSACRYVWMNRWTSEQMNVLTCEWLNEYSYRWKSVCVNRWMNIPAISHTDGYIDIHTFIPLTEQVHDRSMQMPVKTKSAILLPPLNPRLLNLKIIFYGLRRNWTHRIWYNSGADWRMCRSYQDTAENGYTPQSWWLGWQHRCQINAEVRHTVIADHALVR